MSSKNSKVNSKNPSAKSSPHSVNRKKEIIPYKDDIESLERDNPDSNENNNIPKRKIQINIGDQDDVDSGNSGSEENDKKESSVHKSIFDKNLNDSKTQLKQEPNKADDKEENRSKNEHTNAKEVSPLIQNNENKDSDSKRSSLRKTLSIRKSRDQGEEQIKYKNDEENKDHDNKNINNDESNRLKLLDGNPNKEEHSDQPKNSELSNRSIDRILESQNKVVEIEIDFIDEDLIMDLDKEYEMELQNEELEKIQKENNQNIKMDLNPNVNNNNVLSVPQQNVIQVENKNTLKSNQIDIEMQNVAPIKENMNQNNSGEPKRKILKDEVSNKDGTGRKKMGKSASQKSINATQKIKINLEDIENEYILKEGRVDGEINPNDPEQMKGLIKEVDLLLPRKLEEGKLKKHEVCTDFGWFCCGEKYRKSAIENLGVGTDCYFKVLKVFIVCFLLISLINVPLFFVYYNNNKDKEVANYRDALFKLTIGNLASTVHNCAKLSFADIIKNSILSYSFTLDCKNSVISKANTFGMVSDPDDDFNNIVYCGTFTSQNNIVTDSTCDLSSYVNDIVVKDCLNKNTCSFDIDLLYVRQNCKFTASYDYFYFSYSCYTEKIRTGIYDQLVDRGTWAYVIVVIDILSILILLISMFVITSNLRQSDAIYKERFILISNYTSHLKDAGINSRNVNNEFNDILRHFAKVLEIEAKNEGYQNIREMKDNSNITKNNYLDASSKVDKFWIEKNVVYDMNYSFVNSNKLEDIKRLNLLKVQKKRLGNEVIKNKVTSEKKSEKIFKRIDDLTKKITNLEEKIHEKELHENRKIDDVFITFRNQKIANLINSAYSKSKCKRCCYIFCCRGYKIKHLYYKNRWVNLSETQDEPTNINWSNLTYNKCLRTIRVIFSFIVAIILILSSFGVVIASKYALMQVTSDYNPDIDCSYISKTDYKDETKIFNEFNDQNIKNGTKYLTYCYCLDKLISEGPLVIAQTQITMNSKTITPCESWFDSFLKYNSVNLGIAIVIPIVNSVLVIFLRLFAKFEKNRTLTEEITSVMWKIFILQLLNSGIVIVIVNLSIESVKNWNSSFPLFTGRFSDMDPAWYFNVGVTIVFYMILNIMIPHVSALIQSLITCFFRCRDSGCTSGRKTKLFLKSDYLQMYAGSQFPIDCRYSEILTTIFVSLIYSSGMPLLYVCVLGYFILTYWVDKLLLLRFYRSPPKYDLYLAKIFNVLVFFGIILHYLFGIWIYGNPNLLTNNVQTALDSLSAQLNDLIGTENLTGFTKEIVQRLTLSHNILCLIFLAVTIVILFLRLTLFPVLFWLIEKKLSKEERFRKIERKNLEIGLGIPFNFLVKNHELRKLKFIQFRKSKNDLKPSGNDLVYLNLFYQNSILYDKEFLKYKCEKIYKIDTKDSEKEFDNFVKRIMISSDEYENPIIEGDISYNLAYIPEYENIGYHEYLKGIINSAKK